MVPGLAGYIFLEGLIGVGKASLARSFPCCSADPLLAAIAAHIERVNAEEVCQSPAERTHAARCGGHYFNPSLATN